MPSIMANVSRSRRIWMNSFATMAQNRCQLNFTSNYPSRLNLGSTRALARFGGRLVRQNNGGKGSTRGASNCARGGRAPQNGLKRSRVIVLCGFHQADENVFQSRLNLFPVILARDQRTHARAQFFRCLLYTSPSPRDRQKSRM